ncbi:MAG: hypothetical protein IJS79_07650 [Oscillospiraceae bacterium]|nr:hypothetical protein [Oscillospiraceae bacterium]
MSWEVPGMSLATWSFNRGIARDLLRRCWLLWAVYFLALLLLLPVSVMSSTRNPYSPDRFFNYTVLSAARPCVVLSAVFTLLCVMAAFGWMYNMRGSAAMGSLPVSRPSLFLSSYLTVLGMCLAAVVLTALVTLAVAVPTGMAQAGPILLWAAVTGFGVVAFLGFAAFCAMLTGNLLFLPLVWLLIGSAAVAAEYCLRHLMAYFIFGMPVAPESFGVLSPLYRILAGLSVSSVFDEAGQAVPDAYRLNDVGLMALYAVCGLVLAALALVLFRRRALERAGDAVAFDVLKPLFRFCMAVGCAIVLPAAVFDWRFNRSLFGAGAAVFLAAMSCISAFIGWYGAEMLMRKTTRVFFCGWKRLAALCAAILVFYAVGETDLFGYERRVPAPAEVESVSLRFLTLDEPENIEAVCELQRDIITHKAAHESAGEGQYYELVYHLRDGSSLLRNYRLAVTREALLDPDSDFRRMGALFNCREAILERTLGDFPYENMLIAGGAIGWQTEEGYQHLSLSSDEAQKLFFGALLPDLEAGRIGQEYYYYETPEQYTDATNVTVEILGMPLDRNDTDRQYYLSLTVQTYSDKTAAALRETYDIDPVPYGTIYPPDEYSLLYGALD